MDKNITIIGFLSLAVAFSANAHDSDRVDQLEKDLREVKAQLAKLESLIIAPNIAQKSLDSSDGWKSVINWRKLTKGMSPSEVRKILGEPHRLDGGTIARWFYQNDGRVLFYDEKVEQWTEPRQ